MSSARATAVSNACRTSMHYNVDPAKAVGLRYKGKILVRFKGLDMGLQSGTGSSSQGDQVSKETHCAPSPIWPDICTLCSQPVGATELV
ncbi:hypothetical protein WJX75_000037 [Coccomyxa subellipsoidea]|uniref:Uncharacterized protein n=1 Tax=Coccomyxa subellipsoidea TaxID=248742 RepID=A0ABR2Z038_9CHLO